MKKILVMLITVLILVASFSIPASAASYKTYTFGPSGSVVETQTAYEPKELVRMGLNSPEDLYYEKDSKKIYIADTGNKRVLRCDLNGNPELTFGEGTLKNPTGIAAKGDKVYVADKEAETVFIFSKNGKLEKKVTRPKEAIFGKNSAFVPTKIDVDDRGNIFCASEGNVNGVLQISADGEFFGYVGANITPISFSMLLKRMFYSKEQKEAMLASAPPSPTAIALSSQGLLYTVTSGATSETIKKLNTIGNTVMIPKAEPEAFDIAVDNDENVVSVDTKGQITVFDSFGEMLFKFGGMDTLYERRGFLHAPTAIDVTEKGEILALDKSLNSVVVYKPTDFAQLVFEGSRKYKDGLYVEGKPEWEKILKLNSSFILSYKAIASANIKLKDYNTALDQFIYSEDHVGYSEAFWQIRNVWIGEYAGTAIMIIILIFVLLYILKFIQRKTKCFNFAINIWIKFKNIPFISRVFFIGYMLKHPIDGYYEIKHRKVATVGSATFWYIWFAAIQVISIYLLGFLFNPYDLHTLNLFSVIAKSLVPILLWVVANYLVSTISEGEGTFKQVYISTIYSLAPYLIFAIPAMALTNVLTYNEAFVYDFIMLGLYAWSGIYIFINIKEIHNYKFSETLKNIIVTFFTIVLIVLFAYIVYILFNQEIEFFGTMIREVANRG